MTTAAKLIFGIITTVIVILSLNVYVRLANGSWATLTPLTQVTPYILVASAVLCFSLLVVVVVSFSTSLIRLVGERVLRESLH